MSIFCQSGVVDKGEGDQIWSMQLLNAPLMALIMCTWYIFFTQ